MLCGVYRLLTEQQQKQKQSQTAQNDAADSELHRAVLNRYTLKGARSYLKLVQGRQKEKRNLEYLAADQAQVDRDMVEVRDVCYKLLCLLFYCLCMRVFCLCECMALWAKMTDFVPSVFSLSDEICWF